MTKDPPLILDFAELDRFFEALRERGFEVIGPVVRDGAVVLEEITGASHLPVGWRDEQAPARYRLTRDAGPRAFAFTVGPHSWKRFLHPPVLALGGSKGNGDSRAAPARPRAFFGVRPCELAAIARLDRVMAGGPVREPAYVERRDGAFLVALNCTEPGGACFCASMGTGPRATDGFDVLLTELALGGVHRFLAEAGSDRGRDLLAALPTRRAEAQEIREAEAAVSEAGQRMGRTLDTRGLPERLRASYEHPRWEEVGGRCLGCANCTLVCPTCFCWTVDDTTDLLGTAAARTRRWDSCFGLEFSFIHGGSVRTTRAARYRHWMLHKLSTWHDQFGTSGCVGCGRCITWCPAGIDITEEARAVAAAPPGGAP
ncbi:MAG TPA: 4Fe-4S dicluster domain-containing protein [Vicinamibacteria bacterium]